MSASAGSEFAIEAMSLDGVSVGREDGQLVARRDLADDEVSLEDVIDLAHEHGLTIQDSTVDVPAGETRLHLEADGDE